MMLLMMFTVVRIVEMLTKFLSRMFTVVREEEMMMMMMAMMMMMLLMMFTVVREEEIREAAEERPQAGQEAVAVPGDHEEHEQLVVKTVTKTV